MGAEDNRAVVRGTYESFERGGLEALFAALADDIVWVNHTPNSTVYGEHKGLDRLRTMVEKIGDELDIINFQLQTLVADGDHVVTVATRPRR